MKPISASSGALLLATSLLLVLSLSATAPAQWTMTPQSVPVGVLPTFTISGAPFPQNVQVMEVTMWGPTGVANALASAGSTSVTFTPQQINYLPFSSYQFELREGWSFPPGQLYGVFTATVAPPSTPTITSLSPSVVSVGYSAFTLGIYGQNLRESNHAVELSILHNGTDLTPGWALQGGASDLHTTIPSGTLPAPGTYDVIVRKFVHTHGAGEWLSTPPATLTVENAAPTVSAATLDTSGALASLTVDGTGFSAQSTVLWDGTPLVTSFVSNTVLQADVPPAFYFPGAMTASITVENPAPGGGISNAWPLAIQTPVASVTSLGAGYLLGPAPLLSCTPPVLGATSVVTVLDLPVGQPFTLYAGMEANTPLVPWTGYAIHLDMWRSVAIYGSFVPPTGQLAVLVPIPSNPAVAGAARVLQATVVDPTLPQGFTLTNGARVTFGD